MNESSKLTVLMYNGNSVSTKKVVIAAGIKLWYCNFNKKKVIQLLW